MTECLVCGSAAGNAFDAFDHLHGVRGPFQVLTCGSCGAGITLPLVDEDSLGAYYPRNYYTHGPPSGFSALVNRFYVWRRAVRLGLAGRGRGNLLEIGPGDCTFLSFLHARGWNVAGLDPDPAVIDVGRAAGVRMFFGTVPQAPHERFDVILAWHSLEHSVDPRRDMRLLLERLSPHGRLIIGVPDFASPFARYWQSAWHNLDVPRHRVHFTKTAFAVLSKDAGGKITGTQTWLSPQALLQSWQTRSGIKLPPMAETVLELVLSPLCWIAEALGAGDCISVIVTNDASSTRQR